MKNISLLLLLSIIIVLVTITGCIQYVDPSGQDQVPDPQDPKNDDSGQFNETIDLVTFGTTQIRRDGNRYLNGSGDIREDRYIDLKLDGVPLWVVGIPYENGTIWGVVLETGELAGIHSVNNTLSYIDLEPIKIDPGRPIALTIKNGAPSVVIDIFENESKLTHPMILEDGTLAAILSNSSIAIKKDDTIYHLDVNAMLDARILSQGKRIMVLTDPTEEYKHGIMGDKKEAGSITIINTEKIPEVEIVIDIPVGKVIEGISPIWTDLDGDDADEIIVTLSNAEQGAQIVVFDEKGKIKYQGPAIGQGYRWRHQLAVAPFNEGHGLELVDILTPHIGGKLEFYHVENSELRVETSLSGYSSHMIGSRNLDMALTGDLDGDGTVEIIVPDQSFSKLSAIEIGSDGAFEDWNLMLSGKLSTNIMGLSDHNGVVHIAAGMEDGTFRIWSSEPSN